MAIACPMEAKKWAYLKPQWLDPETSNLSEDLGHVRLEATALDQHEYVTECFSPEPAWACKFLGREHIDKILCRKV